ncbi:MAG: hypothetical protein HYU36_11630 [Planctomycetes bacterium]|nr:hypothetical protein [Planctomycetota bacterium]
MNKSDNEIRVRDWLKAAKTIVLKLVERDERLQALCPRYVDKLHDEEASELRSRIVWLGDEVLDLSNRMQSMEEGAGVALGVRALFGDQELEPWVRPAVAVLAMMNLFDFFTSEARTVGALADLLSARDPEIALRIRESFRPDGLLRSIAVVHPDRLLQRYHLDGMAEEAFTKCLGLPRNEEVMVIDSLEPLGRRR